MIQPFDDRDADVRQILELQDQVKQLKEWILELCDRLEIAETCEENESRRRKSEKLITKIRSLNLENPALNLKWTTIARAAPTS